VRRSLARTAIMSGYIPDYGVDGQEDSEKNPRANSRGARGTRVARAALRTARLRGTLGGGVAAALWGLILVPLLAGCSGDLGERLQSGQVLAWHGLQGRWVGSVVPVDPACGSTTEGLMSIGEKGFGFDPFQSTTVIQGTVSSDGHFSGKLARQGAEHQNLSIGFEATATGSDAIDGTLQSGRCHWTVTLHRG
jgi:hypothetical protein